LLGQRRQRLFLAGDALDRDGIDGDDVDPREEALGPVSPGLAVFGHQRFAEPLLGLPVVDDPDPAEQAHAAIGETRIALEPAVVEDTVLLVDLEADPRLSLDVGAQMSARAGGVQIHFAVDPEIEQRDAIGEAVLAHRRKTAAIAA
jgi:hypothetical protein